jgi:hypothetical protein
VTFHSHSPAMNDDFPALASRNVREALSRSHLGGGVPRQQIVDLALFVTADDCGERVGQLPAPRSRHRHLPSRGCGGVAGYAEFLEAQADPNHEAHAEMMEWHGGRFDREDLGIGRILDSFEQLARKWAPKPRKQKVIRRPL